jgi:N-methylhydantoinase A
MILGADVGGTFTDLVLVRGRKVVILKVPTSAVQSNGMATGAASISDGKPIDSFLHGTTVATNMLLERKGARTALVTDMGFEDVIEIGRQDRPSLYDSFDDRPEPLVERGDRFGIGEDVDLLDRDLRGIESVAIATIHGHTDGGREHRIENRVRELGFVGPISRSSVVAPEFREFERTSTTVLNAYLGPRVGSYLNALEDSLVGAGLARHVSVMQSSGGLTSIADAADTPAAILLSGPAGGVIATAAYAKEHGHDRVVSFDMGGTSTDVCRIEHGGFDVSYERSIDGYACRLPSAGVHTVGAGGGSIAWIDPGGSLRVGPQSAGAVPGPACYGHGGIRPTVSDANVVLGRIAPDAALGGTLTVDRRLAESSIEPLAAELNLAVHEAAAGIVAIAEQVMAQAIRKVSIEQGSDPRGAFLYAFGGAGGLHASALARSLDMAGVVIPPYGGVFSALGLLLAPPRADVAMSLLGSDGSIAAVSDAAAVVESRASSKLRETGHVVTSVEFIVDVRYLGQSHEIGVTYRPGDSLDDVVERFHNAHRHRNGFIRQSDSVEIVTIRAAALGAPALDIGSVPGPVAAGRPPAHRSVRFGGEPTETSVVHRANLVPGDHVVGPTIIEEDESTIVIGPGESMRVLSTGALEVTW